MRQTLPNTIERAVALLIPPASREPVLGDLRERNETTAAYIIDAIKVVPYTIWSRVRRTTSPELLLLQAAALSASFLAGAWLYRGSFFLEPTTLIRLAIPASAALIALLISDAYVADPKSWRADPIAIASALVLGGLTQGVLFLAYPDWVLTHLRAALIVGNSFMLILAVRTWRRHGSGAQLLRAKPSFTPRDLTNETSVIRPVPLKVRLLAMFFPLYVSIIGTVVAYSRTGIERIPYLVVILVSLYSVFRVYRLPGVSLDTRKARWSFGRDLFLRWCNAPILATAMAVALEQPLRHPERLDLLPPILPFVAVSCVWSYLAWKWSARRA